MPMLHRASAVLVIFALIIQPAWGRPQLFRRSWGMQTQSTDSRTTLPANRKLATPSTPATAPAPEASAQVKPSEVAPPKFPPEPVVKSPPAISLDKKDGKKEETPPPPVEAFTAKPNTTPDWWARVPTGPTKPALFITPEAQTKPEQTAAVKPFTLVPIAPEVKSDTGNTQEAAPPPPPEPGVRAPLISPEAATTDPYTPPVLELTGVDKPLPLGELVQIGIKPPATKPERLRASTYTWTVLPSRNTVVWPDASKILFGAGTRPQIYTVIVTGSYVFAPDTSIDPKAEVVQRLVTKVQQVQVGDGSIPTPTDPNSPAPDLTPVARKIYEFTQLVATDSNYNMASFKMDAALLSRNFADIVKAIEDPDPAKRATLATILDIMKATKSRNDSNKVSNRTAWQAWFDQTEELLRQAYSSNTIKSPQDAAVWWRDISAGLAAAAR